MRATLPILALLLLAACDGGEPEMPDAGEPDGVFMTVTAAGTRDALNGVAPRMGFQYYLLDVTLETRGVGPISVAPFAFTVTLEDGSPIMGDSRTDEIAMGCTSQMVGVDETLACRIVFEVLVDAAPPVTLRWTDGSESASAMVPPLG